MTSDSKVKVAELRYLDRNFIINTEITSTCLVHHPLSRQRQSSRFSRNTTACKNKTKKRMY
jgi:hypothetical protein